MTKTSFIRIAVITTVVSFAWILLTPVIFPLKTSQAAITAPQKGFIAPDFTLPTPDGQQLSLSEFRGKSVLVFFWASWCSVCKKTMPDFQLVYEDYKFQGFEVLAINTTNNDSLTNAIDSFSTLGYDFQLLLDMDGSVSEAYRVYALPTAFLVNPDGIVQDVVIGSGLSAGYLRALLSQIHQEGK